MDPDPTGSVSFWPPGSGIAKKSAKIMGNSHKNRQKSPYYHIYAHKYFANTKHNK